MAGTSLAGTSLAENASANSLLREEVTANEIADIVCKWTGIPATRLVEGERDKLLHLDELQQIVELLIQDLRGRLAERHIGLELSVAAREHIAREAYDPVYGARPLKRFLQHQLETKIGRALIAGEIGERGTIEVGLADGQLAVTLRSAEVEAEAVTA